MSITHAERAVRRQEILAAVREGYRRADVAKAFGVSRVYVDQIASGVVSSLRSELAMRRTAAASEMALLGVPRRRAAELIGVCPQTLSTICRRAGIEGFAYDTSDKWADVISASRKRASIMAALYRDGYTLVQIGQQFNITRERVRQLMAKHFGTNAMSGGKHIQGERERMKREAAYNAKCLAKYGCTAEQFKMLKALRKPLYAFQQQRRNSRVRGIEWHFTLWEWWSVWDASGHWAERGRGQGYVMCRKNDVGPYSPSNVYISTAAHNSSEGQRRKRKDPSLPIGVKRTPSGKFEAHRRINGKKFDLGKYETPELAYAAYLMAADTSRVAA